MKCNYIDIPLERLRESPLNPRKHYDQERIDALAQSIADFGVLQPLVVRSVGQELWEIVCGHCRARAARQAGLRTVPAMVRKMNDRTVAELELSENLQRSDLTPLEEAVGVDQLVRAGASQSECAAVCGRSEGWVQLRLDLLGLPEPARAAVDERRLSIGAAAALRLVPEEERWMALEEFLLPGFGGRPMGAREAAAWVEERFVAPARREEAWQEVVAGYKCGGETTEIVDACICDHYLSRGLPRHGFVLASGAVPSHVLKGGMSMTWGTAANKLGVPWLIVPHFGLDDNPVPVALVNESDVLMADGSRSDAKQPNFFELGRAAPGGTRTDAGGDEEDGDADSLRRLVGMLLTVTAAADDAVLAISRARDAGKIARLVTRFDLLASTLADVGFEVVGWNCDAALAAAREAESVK